MTFHGVCRLTATISRAPTGDKFAFANLMTGWGVGCERCLVGTTLTAKRSKKRKSQRTDPSHGAQDGQCHQASRSLVQLPRELRGLHVLMTTDIDGLDCQNALTTPARLQRHMVAATSK